MKHSSSSSSTSSSAPVSISTPESPGLLVPLLVLAAMRSCCRRNRSMIARRRDLARDEREAPSASSSSAVAVDAPSPDSSAIVLRTLPALSHRNSDRCTTSGGSIATSLRVSSGANCNVRQRDRIKWRRGTLVSKSGYLATSRTGASRNSAAFCTCDASQPSQCGSTSAHAALRSLNVPGSPTFSDGLNTATSSKIFMTRSSFAYCTSDEWTTEPDAANACTTSSRSDSARSVDGRPVTMAKMSARNLATDSLDAPMDTRTRGSGGAGDSRRIEKARQHRVASSSTARTTSAFSQAARRSNPTCIFHESWLRT
mmetsp:Transcript_3572/g.11605  ORF Transcript_3572/g.11605 Transcript_3572/m.11605 type:complete len:313 (+) Transcript_3572:884-1822(+)